MRLVLTQFLRTLKERDEFDRLLPDLLLAMGYVPLAKPQTGVRQYGVDLAAVGTGDDGVEELLLLVIKRGDIGRRDWDSGEPQSVRPSLNDVFDIYIPKLIAPEHARLRKRVILATTGDLKQEVEINWTSYKEGKASEAEFDFWGGDRVADLIERYMLDQNLFAADDRTDLHKALALVAESDYDFRDLSRLLLRQLGLSPDGALKEPAEEMRTLTKTLRRVHLASQICAHWARSEGDVRRALWICERTLLWSYHRILIVAASERKKLYPAFASLWQSYVDAASNYVEVIQSHVEIRDGMAGYGGEGAEIASVLFENLGLLASVGLAALSQQDPDDAEQRSVVLSNVHAVADLVATLIANNAALGSPRLDEHVVDINLALMLLVISGRIEVAKNWLAALIMRLDYTYRVKRKFPIGTDSLEDLVALDVHGEGDEELQERLMSASWCLATFAAWAVMFGLKDSFEALAEGTRSHYSNVCAQLWHPTQGWSTNWYFGSALEQGDTEAPIDISDFDAMTVRMQAFLKIEKYKWQDASPSAELGLFGIDFIACRHFRMPVPASFWYHLSDAGRDAVRQEGIEPV
ncbi:hypothetical protein [Pandoraea sputorum]